MVALAALSVLAVLPLALAGHAAGSASHDTAVNSLAVHLVAAVLWVGGLLGLVVLRPVLGKGLARERGALQHAGRLVASSWSHCPACRTPGSGWARCPRSATPYGVLVVDKVVALVVLGLAGWQQRRRWSDRMATDEGARALFARLAVVEVVVMGVAVRAGDGPVAAAPRRCPT